MLENVVYNPITRVPDYDDASITENTRCAYPIEFIPNAKIPCMVERQPKNIIMLTCDAFGVLPPVAKLSPEQASYHFLAGYTSKTPGTEDGVLEPIPTFSTCYSAPFIVLHVRLHSLSSISRSHNLPSPAATPRCSPSAWRSTTSTAG